MSQINLFGAESIADSPSNICSGLNVVDHGEFLFYPNYFDAAESNHYFSTLRKDVNWKQESMKIYGKHVNFPRLTAWYGDQDKPYSFSGITLQPDPWTTALLEIRERIAPLAEIVFNSVLSNLYRNGNDSISWHTDAEKELGINPVIGSVNFGETRTFQLRNINTKQKLDIALTNGSVLIMKGELQHFWQHQIPKTTKTISERINLTFRHIK